MSGFQSGDIWEKEIAAGLAIFWIRLTNQQQRKSPKVYWSVWLAITFNKCSVRLFKPAQRSDNGWELGNSFLTFVNLLVTSILHLWKSFASLKQPFSEMWNFNPNVFEKRRRRGGGITWRATFDLYSVAVLLINHLSDQSVPINSTITGIQNVFGCFGRSLIIWRTCTMIVSFQVTMLVMCNDNSTVNSYQNIIIA